MNFEYTLRPKPLKLNKNNTRNGAKNSREKSPKDAAGIPIDLSKLRKSSKHQSPSKQNKAEQKNQFKDHPNNTKKISRHDWQNTNQHGEHPQKDDKGAGDAATDNKEYQLRVPKGNKKELDNGKKYYSYAVKSEYSLRGAQEPQQQPSGGNYGLYERKIQKNEWSEQVPGADFGGQRYNQNERLLDNLKDGGPNDFKSVNKKMGAGIMDEILDVQSGLNGDAMNYYKDNRGVNNMVDRHQGGDKFSKMKFEEQYQPQPFQNGEMNPYGETAWRGYHGEMGSVGGVMGSQVLPGNDGPAAVGPYSNS